MVVLDAYENRVAHSQKSTQHTTFARYDYDAYGNITSDQEFATALITLDQAQQISAVQPLRYAGYVWDSETGLYYCSQRYYDPSTASFISRDPAKADGEKSPYLYCAGEPVGGTDLSGETKKVLGVSLVAQMKTNWCACACLQMLYNYKKGKPISQATIHQYGAGNTDNTGLSLTQTLKAAKTLGFRNVSWQTSPLTFKGVQSQIDHYGPVIVGIYWRPKGAHAVVIYGYNTSGNYLNIDDPGTVTHRTLTYDTVKNNYPGNGYWALSYWDFWK